MKRTMLALMLLPLPAMAQTTDERVFSLEAFHGSALCGNTVLNVGAEETCDDGNLEDGDGCSATCQIEIVVPPPPPPPPPPPATGKLADMEWRSIPGSEMRSIYDPAIDDQWRARLGKWPQAFERVQSAWSGGTCSDGKLYVMGGGHNDSPHNGVFALDVQTGAWERFTLPTGTLWDDMNCPTGVCETPYGDCNVGRCNTQPDNQPASRHTYYLLTANDEAIYIASGSTFEKGTAGDPPTAWKLDLATRTWSPLPEPPFSKAHGSLVHVDGRLYFTTANGKGFAIYDIVANEWSQPGANITGISGLSGMVYASGPDRFIFLGNNRAHWIDRANFGVALNSIPNATALNAETYLGLTYYEPEDLVLLWKGGKTITTLNATTLEWGEVALPGIDPGASLSTGTFGRFSYCGGRVVLVNGVDVPMFYLHGEAPAPPPPPPPPPDPPPPPPPGDGALTDPYYAAPFDIVARDCGSQPEAWPVFDIREDADLDAAKRWVIGKLGRVRVHWRPEPYGSLQVKDGLCTMVEGVPGPAGELPIIASVNATRAFKAGYTIRPGGLIVSKLDVSAGKAGAAGSGVSDCIGVPNNQTFLIIRDSEVTRCGHHSFITSPSAHHLYVELGRSHFEQASSHLAYIDTAAFAWVYDSTFSSPGWGHALRCLARTCIIERTKVSNVNLDGTQLPPGGDNPLEPTRVYLGQHPLDLYVCGNNTVRDVELTLWPEAGKNGFFGVNLARARNAIRSCDVGEVADGQWTLLVPNTPEYMDPARWVTVTPLDTLIDGLTFHCVGPDADRCSTFEVDGIYPQATNEETDALSQWLKANLFPTMDAMRAAVPADTPWWRWVGFHVRPLKQATFLKGSITGNVPMPVPLGAWSQRHRVTLRNITTDSPMLTAASASNDDFYCYGSEPLADGSCTDQYDGIRYRQATITQE